MRRWIVFVALIAGGCGTMETTRFVAPIVPNPGVADLAQIKRDEGQCAAYAVERPSETRYATYVACMVSRGHRTYASVVARQGATGITVMAPQRKAPSDVYRDLEHCARTVRVRVDMPPNPETFKGPYAEKLTVESQAPFAQCLNAAGYTTTLHATPEAVIAAAMPPAPARGPVITGPPGPAGSTATAPAPAPAPAMSPPPASAVTPTPLPTLSAPAAGTPSTGTTVAVAPPAAAARPPRPVKLGLYVEPGSRPPVISVVASDTPAGRAGVRPGDVVLRIDGKPIASEDDINAVLTAKAPDDVVRIDLRRGSQTVSVEAILAAQ